MDYLWRSDASFLFDMAFGDVRVCKIEIQTEQSEMYHEHH